jgi:shikimate dehydrogenase
VIRLAVFGSPIRQSSSPAIHGMFAEQCGLDVDYQAIEATAESFAGLLQALAAQGGRGCNVTVPLKKQAWQLAQRSSLSAQRAQAANTLVFESDNDWYADNTDGRGLVQDLSGNLGQPIRASRICIIGAGGAAAGILGDLLAQEPKCITIANRTLERARELQQTFNTGLDTPAAETSEPGPTPVPVVSAISLDDLGIATPFDLVINATSLGHETRHPGLPETIFLPGSLCYDLNYGAAAEPLRTFCGEMGISYEDGLGMLVEQAALSFELWTGRSPETAPVLRVLRQL